MSEWKELAGWMYGDVRADRGFWYAHPLHEVEGMGEADLFWVPDENCLCMLWHVGHIAHRERLHIGRFLQGLGEDIFPAGYEIFGDRWCSVDEVRGSIDSVQNVLSWVEEVRQQSTEYVESLNEEDWHKVPPTAEFDLSTAHWLFLTISHGAIHIGRIQMLRAMLEGRHDNPC